MGCVSRWTEDSCSWFRFRGCPIYGSQVLGLAIYPPAIAGGSATTAVDAGRWFVFGGSASRRWVLVSRPRSMLPPSYVLTTPCGADVRLEV